MVFFVKEGLKVKESNDVNRKIANEGHEFHYCRIEIVNCINSNGITGVFYYILGKTLGMSLWKI